MPTEYEGGNSGYGSETAHGRDWPCLRQFCVFLENRVGQLRDLMGRLEDQDTRVLALSISDSVEFAMVRIVFNNNERAREKLRLTGQMFSESDVLGVELPDNDSPYGSICAALLKAELNIHHAYPLMLASPRKTGVVMYVDDVDLAMSVLREQRFVVLTEADLLDD